MMQILIVTIIVAAAVGYLAWKIKGILTGAGGGCCGGSSCQCSTGSDGLTSLGGPGCPGMSDKK